MAAPILSKKKAHAVSNGVFLISLAILIFTGAWWPGLLLAIWATLASRQYLNGRHYTAALTTFVLVGLFIISYIKYDFDVLAPVLLAVGGIFLMVKELYFESDTNGEDKSVEIREDAELDE